MTENPLLKSTLRPIKTGYTTPSDQRPYDDRPKRIQVHADEFGRHHAFSLGYALGLSTADVTRILDGGPF